MIKKIESTIIAYKLKCDFCEKEVNLKKGEDWICGAEGYHDQKSCSFIFKGKSVFLDDEQHFCSVDCLTNYIKRGLEET